MTTIKACKDCRWFQAADQTCHHKTATYQRRDYINGTTSVTYGDAAFMRKMDVGCGDGARHFEPQEDGLRRIRELEAS